MGEARRKRLAREAATAAGLLVPRPPNCPGCGARGVHHIAATEIPEALRALGCDCEHGYCPSCGALWEAFPPLYAEDPVASEPCGNCAFRPGSPEQRDPEAWRAMIEQLRPDGSGWFSGRFYCHKGVPIDRGAGPGNFLFPQRDGAPDERRMRTCSGFLRMFWALNRKKDAAVG